MRTVIKLTLLFHKETDGVWVGVCKELGTATQADSLEQVQRELIDLLQLHLNGLEEVGERERFFRENGITILHNHSHEEETIDAPTDPAIFSQPYVTSLAPAC